MGTEPHFLASRSTWAAKRKAGTCAGPALPLPAGKASTSRLPAPRQAARSLLPRLCAPEPAGNLTASPGLLSTCQTQSAGLLFHLPQPVRRWSIVLLSQLEKTGQKSPHKNEILVRFHKKGDQKRNLIRKEHPLHPFWVLCELSRI